MKSVKKFYTSYVQKEWDRLAKSSYQKLEFDTTLHFLKKHLPKNGLILDAGGGPGRYTIELVKQGYDVVLLDITPANLEFAKKEIKKVNLQTKVKEITSGSIVDLSQFSDNTFDAVICSGGPLSHIIEEKKRDKAITELIRVAKKGAPIFVSVMGKLSLVRASLRAFPHEMETPRFKKYRDTGDYVGKYGFTACHFFVAEELRAAFAKKNVEIVALAGLEGIGSNFKKEIDELAKHKKRWNVWLETHYKTCTLPSIVDTSEHILIICRKV